MGSPSGHREGEPPAPTRTSYSSTHCDRERERIHEIVSPTAPYAFRVKDVPTMWGVANMVATPALLAGVCSPPGEGADSNKPSRTSYSSNHRDRERNLMIQ